MIYASDLIALFKKAHDEAWGYIWGRWGQTWTAANQAAATRPMTVAHGSKWIGQRVADCSGLFRWAFSQLGGSIYHGSNTIWNQYCTVQGKLVNGKRDDGFELRPGTAVFMYNKKDGKRGHIGLYIGGGLVIEAKGTKDGVVISKIERWHEWGELKGVDYGRGDSMDEIKMEVVNVMLKQGDRGAAVKKLQRILNLAGFDSGTVDGIFGKNTTKAVKEFQAAHDLKVDGIVGGRTWSVLDKIDFEQKKKAEETAKDVPDIIVGETQTPIETETPKERTVILSLPQSVAAYLYEALKGVIT